ncbi:TIR-like protein FxsC [Streptomyces sp. NPDC056716]|uniref:TIR-like protein FxsC n=1 Tax=unclassified Streptomyces TaxID=2593676 RepID=UPI0036A97907
MTEQLARSRPRRGVQHPYGFLSYGRTPHVPDSDGPADSRLVRFHGKLTEDVMALTDLDAHIPAVYLDRRTALGAGWQDALKEHLARCQVLVPVLSPRLFTSAWCAVEWQCFQLRQRLQRERGTFTRNAVVPVLWNPLRPEDVPSPYADLQYTHEDLGDDYARDGLLGLLTGGRHTTANRVVYQLARKIVEVAESARLEPCDPALFDALFDAVHRAEPQPSGTAPRGEHR